MLPYSQNLARGIKFSLQERACFWAFLKSSGLIIPVSTAFEPANAVQMRPVKGCKIHASWIFLCCHSNS